MALNEALLSLAGLSVGDAFGQSFFLSEGNAAITNRILTPPPWRWTDDTHMALSVVDELRQRGWIDQDSLAQRMARLYMSDPARGYGAGTAQTLERIAHGEYFRSVSSALFGGGSFGCASSARAAPVGAFFSGNLAHAIREARLTSGITHMHPAAISGAEAVAAAAALAASPSPPSGAEFLQEILRHITDLAMVQSLQNAIAIPACDYEGARELLDQGPVGSAMSVVPFSLWCAAHNLNDFEEALWQAAAGLGVRDTICAITGALVAVSSRRIPVEWLNRREILPHNFLPVTTSGPIPDAPPVWSFSPPTGNKPPIVPEHDLHTDPIRVDTLTNLPNLLGLLKWVDHQVEANPPEPFTLIAIQLVSLWEINRQKGRMAGDELLRWSAESLRSFTTHPLFRAGGDKFVLAVTPSSEPDLDIPEFAAQLARNLSLTELRPPRTAVIQFSPQDEINPGLVLACLFVAHSDRYYTVENNVPRIFAASEIQKMSNFPYMLLDLAEQMKRMAGTAEESVRLSQTDSVSQLPNMRAAINTLDRSLGRARDAHKPLAILMMDGDNLRRYNEVNMEAGDEAIRQLGRTLQSQLRETDFIARWRTGDEFLVILPDTNRDTALQIGRRLCASVRLASRAWLLPTTISAGLALYPYNGLSAQDILDSAEQSLRFAKRNGKNQVHCQDPD